MGRERRLPLDGSEPAKLPPRARRSTAAVDLAEEIEVTLVVRSRGSHEEWRKLVAELTSGLPGERRYLSHAEFARQWNASPEDLAAVRKFAKAHRLKVVSSDPFRRCVVVRGSLRRHSRAFGVVFHAVKHPLGTFRSHRPVAQVPESIHPLIECVLGLDNVPLAHPHAAAATRGSGMNRQALLDAYAIPPRLHGKGQCIAIIELGGGFYKRDIKAYFSQLGLAPPRVRTRGIGGVKNNPASRDDIRKFLEGIEHPQVSGGKRVPITGDPKIDRHVEWTIETTTDIAMAGTIAPEASILLVLTSNTPQAHYHAITSVIADRKNAPSVLSCSWGGPEPRHTPSQMRTMDRWFQAAAVLGMTVCVSSGDAGAGSLYAGPNAFVVDFPASSPHVLACGGTTLHPKAGTEVAWKQKRGGLEISTGGGFSEFFPLPSWQRSVGIKPRDWLPRGIASGTGRAIPDIAAKANLENAYSIIVGGMETPAGGTSAAAPIWAAVFAILNEALQTRVGLLLLPLYEGALRKGLRDIVAGDNGAFAACKGWDACTGWGSPRAEGLLRTLRGDA